MVLLNWFVGGHGVAGSFLECYAFYSKKSWFAVNVIVYPTVVSNTNEHDNDPGMPNDCKEVVDRRSGIDRRVLQSDSKDMDRRRGPGRRRSDFLRSAEEGEMTQEQFLFLLAIPSFKEANGRTFPTWTDVLEVVRKLGYRKTMKSEIDLGTKGKDWTEDPDTPSGV